MTGRSVSTRLERVSDPAGNAVELSTRRSIYRFELADQHLANRSQAGVRVANSSVASAL
ncbi:MAG: hypothetical protein H6718_09205 [Polyangiaceae bacterium]|nr:hypothetical protein [Polyangiaceae bacterium]